MGEVLSICRIYSKPKLSPTDGATIVSFYKIGLVLIKLISMSHSTLVWFVVNRRGLFNAKAILEAEEQLYYLNHKRVHTFPKSICPNGNIIVRLEFELSYFHVAIQHICHYAMKNSPRSCPGLVASL